MIQQIAHGLIGLIMALGTFPELLAANAGDAIEKDQLADTRNLNRPERLEWLQDAGFGMFIHWSVDAQLGGDISHVMADADPKVLDWYFSTLPTTCNPKRFDPAHWMNLAKLAGMRYAVFTTKHHNGFCWWNTATTRFNVMETPYRKDLVGQIVEATRASGLGVGIYYSPEDFAFLHQNGLPVTRPTPTMDPAVTKRYEELVRTQTRELMTNYGKIDVLFIDGAMSDICRAEAWRCNPDLLVTRGAIATPEQHLPGRAIPDAWESCITMGNQWSYKATEEEYKSSSRILDILVETRAKGGALLLNVGPRPDGELPVEQEGRLVDLALWHAFNGEAIHDTRPWIVTNEGDIWFTRRKDTPQDDATVYAMMTGVRDWARGERKTITFHSIAADQRTKVTFLGQNEKTLEYKPAADPSTTFKQTGNGLEVSAMRTLRFTTNGKAIGPMVLKLEHVHPAAIPPAVETLEATVGPKDMMILHGRILDLGDSATVQAGFEYQEYLGFTEALNNVQWTRTTLVECRASGSYEIPVTGLTAGKTYKIQAIVVHPKLTMRGEYKRITIGK